MISQEIYEYLTSMAPNSAAEFPKLHGVIIDKGILVQILQDGMVTFHDVKE